MGGNITTKYVPSDTCAYGRGFTQIKNKKVKEKRKGKLN